MRILGILFFMLSLLGLLSAAPLRQTPEVGRGMVIDGNLAADTAKDLRQRGLTVVVFEIGDTNDKTLNDLRRNVETAQKSELQSVVLLEPAANEVDIQDQWRKLLKTLAPCGQAIRGCGLAAGPNAAGYENKVREFLAEFRRDYPETWLIFAPADFRNLAPLPDERVTYLATFDAQSPTAPVLEFLKQSKAPLLAAVKITDPAALMERIHEFDAKNWSWYTVPANRTRAEELELLRRPFQKGASFDERYRGLAEEFAKVRQPGSLNFAFITDTHYQLRDFGRNGYGGSSVESMTNMARMAKQLKLDFVANAGDMVDGNSPRELNLKEISASMQALQSSGLPVLVAIGNHDDGTYYCRKNARDGAEAITNKEWRDRVVAPILDRAVADGANAAGNYYYYDFPDRKIRVIVLASSDNPLIKNEKGELKYFSINTFIYTQKQLSWLADKALNFEEKPDASKWSVLLISHAPPEEGINGKVAVEIIKAFQRGIPCRPEPTTAGDFPQDISHDFSRQGPMRVLALLHGHYHVQYSGNKNGYLQIGFLPGLNYRNSPNHPPRGLDTPDMECWTVISVDPAKNLITGLRFGAGNDFCYPLPVTP